MGAVAFSDLITFTRSTGGGRFNAQGVYEWLPANTPRIDYDPVTGECLGLLVEEQRTNLLPYSSDFANAVWTKNRSSVTANAATAPDGTASADKLVEDTSINLSHGVIGSASIVASNTYSLSVFVKAAERSFCRVSLTDSSFANGCFVEVSLTTGGVFASGPIGAGILAGVSIASVGSGWYRIAVTGGIATASAARSFISPHNGTTISYTGDGTSGIYIWGAQLEQASSPSSYIPTTNAQVTRAADIPSVNALSPWFNASEFSIYVEASLQDTSGVRRYVTLAGGPQAIRLRAGNGAYALQETSGAGQLNVPMINPAPVAGRVDRLACAVKQNACALSVNGSAVVGDTTTTLSLDAFDSLRIGGLSGLEALNGHIKQIRYYPRRLSDTELQALTA